MYIKDYISHLEGLSLNLIFHKSLKFHEIKSLVYFHWLIQNFYDKEPDSPIRLDFKCEKNDSESLVLVLDDYGIEFKKEGNLTTENGHESYGYIWGYFTRNKDDNYRYVILQTFTDWFEEVEGFLDSESSYVEVTYYEESFSREINHKKPEDDWIDDEAEDDFELNSTREFPDERGTWLYNYGHNNTARFLLGRKSENPIVVLGLNPSTADHKFLDPTCKSIERLIQNAGYNGWMLINLYPKRATDPFELPDEINRELHQENLNLIEHLFKSIKNPLIYCAWGNGIEIRPYLLSCLKDIFDLSKVYDFQWVSFGGVTQKGHPRHPLYIKSETFPESFDIEGYLYG